VDIVRSNYKLNAEKIIIYNIAVDNIQSSCKLNIQKIMINDIAVDIVRSSCKLNIQKILINEMGAGSACLTNGGVCGKIEFDRNSLSLIKGKREH
ncbi:MAG: hypothetical protein II782_06445, partial [Oscillospiraceae bacterium]|nr:hypothetical protein [Oscillospiraceae bacterium]